MNRSLYYSLSAIFFSLSFFILALALLQTYCGISPYKPELTNYRCPTESFGYVIPIIASSIFSVIFVQIVRLNFLLKIIAALIIAIPAHSFSLFLSAIADRLFYLDLFGYDTEPIFTKGIAGLVGVPLLTITFILFIYSLQLNTNQDLLKRQAKFVIKIALFLIACALVVLIFKYAQVMDSSKRYRETYNSLNQQFCSETQELQNLESKISVDPEIKLIDGEFHVDVKFSEILQNNYEATALLRFSNDRSFKMREKVFWEITEPLFSNGTSTLQKRFIFRLVDVQTLSSNLFQRSVESGDLSYLAASNEISFYINLQQSFQNPDIYKAPELGFYCYQPLFEEVPIERQCHRKLFCNGVSLRGETASTFFNFSNLELSQ